MSHDEASAEIRSTPHATADTEPNNAEALENSSTPLSDRSADLFSDQFAALIRDDAQLFDPIRFDYLQAMQQRATQKSGALQQRLLHKIESGLEAYRESLASQRQHADAALQPLTDTQRQSLAHLYQHHAYQTLIEAAHAYQTEPAITANDKSDREGNNDTPATLDDVITLINQQSQSRLDQQPQSLADQLRAQEQQALHLDDTPAPASTQTPTNLTAVERLRDSVEKQQNPGPVS